MRFGCFLLALLLGFSSVSAEPSSSLVQLSQMEYQKLVEIFKRLKTLNETLLLSSENSQSEIASLRSEIEKMQIELASLKKSLEQSVQEREILSRKLQEVETLLQKALESLKNSERSLTLYSLSMEAKLLKWKISAGVSALVACVSCGLLIFSTLQTQSK